jgi:hypothetical protein
MDERAGSTSTHRAQQRARSTSSHHTTEQSSMIYSRSNVKIYTQMFNNYNAERFPQHIVGDFSSSRTLLPRGIFFLTALHSSVVLLLCGASRIENPPPPLLFFVFCLLCLLLHCPLFLSNSAEYIGCKGAEVSGIHLARRYRLRVDQQSSA